MRPLRALILSLALIPTAVAAADPSPISATFKGKTSQRRAVVIHLVHGMVSSPSRLAWVAQCGNFTLKGVVRFAGRLGNDGSFNPPPGRSATKAGGLRFRQTTSVRLVIHGRAAQGAFKDVTTAYSAAGAAVLRCAPPKVTFIAHS